jgi:hypothetical protein
VKRKRYVWEMELCDEVLFPDTRKGRHDRRLVILYARVSFMNHGQLPGRRRLWWRAWWPLEGEVL